MLNAKRDNFSWFVMVLGIVLLVLNVKLIQQNKMLGTQATTSAQSMHLKPGTELPALAGYDVEGKPLTIGYGEDPRKTLLLVFSPQCRACKENMPNWQAILKQIDRDAYRVVAASVRTEETRKYLQQYGISDLPAIADVDLKVKAAYNMSVAPQTILISPNGVAERVWIGRFNDDDKHDLGAILNIELQ
jgi:peroxiredoxin